MDERILRGESVPSFETVRLHKGGHPVPVSLTLSAVRIGGQIVAKSAIYRNITRQKEAEAQLRRAQETAEYHLARMNLQIKRMPLAYLFSGPDFRYTGWNPAAEHMFGFSEAEVLGRHPFEVVVPPQSQALVESLFDRLAAGDMNAHGVCDNVTRDGRTITCEWYNTPLMDQGGTFMGLLSLAEDITQHSQLEEQFRQAQKMEAVGQLAGGVAHDFNNLLTVINGYSEMLLQGLPLPATRVVRFLNEIRRPGSAPATLTRQLLAFSRKQMVAPKVLDLNAVVADMEKMLRRLIGEDIDLATSLTTGLGRVRADPGRSNRCS